MKNLNKSLQIVFILIAIVSLSAFSSANLNESEEQLRGGFSGDSCLVDSSKIIQNLTLLKEKQDSKNNEPAQTLNIKLLNGKVSANIIDGLKPYFINSSPSIKSQPLKDIIISSGKWQALTDKSGMFSIPSKKNHS